MSVFESVSEVVSVSEVMTLSESVSEVLKNLVHVSETESEVKNFPGSGVFGHVHVRSLKKS